MEGSAIGRVKSSLIGRPKPTVDDFGEEIGTITTIEITQTARSPNIFNV